ncbi:Uncharacterised protein [uncultured archaeon]|nr:Uncharacterised protein [uncultured archaeon]
MAKIKTEKFVISVTNVHTHSYLFDLLQEALEKAQAKGLIDKWRLDEKGNRMRGATERL